MTHTTIDLEEAALYVGTYAKYNNGSLFGAWLKFRRYADKDEFLAACYDLHKDEQDPELMFQDFENFPEKMYNECAFPDGIYELIEALEDFDEDRLTAFFEFCDNESRTEFADAVSDFESAYMGNYDSEEDYAEELADQLGYYDAMDKAGINRAYFDEKSFARDLFIDCWMSETGNVFNNNY